MAITFVLFALALVTEGFTHDLLLEAAVFLVSVKLMLMTHRNSVEARAMNAKLDRICEIMNRHESENDAGEGRPTSPHDAE
jgi:hypothetical protein